MLEEDCEDMTMGHIASATEEFGIPILIGLAINTLLSRPTAVAVPTAFT